MFAAQASAETISNGTVRLGVDTRGQLNASDEEGFFGVNYVPTGNDGTRAGCPCEGWGAGADPAGGDPVFQGRANNSSGIDNATPVSFASTATTATVVVDVLNGGLPGLRVTHEFRPAPTTPNLYEIEITLENRSGGMLENVRYERIMDWDIEPTPFDEFVTINRGSTPPADLIYSDDNGFSDNYPFTSDGPLDPSTVNTNYVDKGPDDHGARFTFDFGSLDAGAEKKFFLYYGAAGTEDEADAAVSAAALEMFSYGQPNTTGGPDEGTPNTFIWGFRAVGGAPVIPPTLDLKPETAENTVGDPHTLTAELRSSTGDPVPGAKIVFKVAGANPQPNATRTTGSDGNATYTYTGTNAGDDTITACLDSNDNGDCDPGEVTDTAKKTYVEGEPGIRGRMVGEGRLTKGSKRLDYAYIIDCTRANNVPPKFKGRLNSSSFEVTSIDSVSCTDDPSKTPAFPSAGFDTQEGTGRGKVGSTNVNVEWKFVDGGTGGANDTSYIKITNQATSAVLFEATGSPPGGPRGAPRPGRNTANPPPSP